MNSQNKRQSVINRRGHIFKLEVGQNLWTRRHKTDQRLKKKKKKEDSVMQLWAKMPEVSHTNKEHKLQHFIGQM